MIELFSGTPGSGKSLHGAQTVRANLKYHRPVIGTFHINKDCLYKNSKYPYYYINIYDLTPKILVDFARKNLDRTKKNPEGSFLLVIDEAQRIFNPRAWNSADRSDWITFFAEHRHLGFDIILISQNDRMLDRQIRALLEYNVIHRKLSEFGLLGKFMSLFSGQFVIVYKWYPLNERISYRYCRGDKKLYNFYDSFEDFDSQIENGGLGGALFDSWESYIQILEKLPSILPPCDTMTNYFYSGGT